MLRCRSLFEILNEGGISVNRPKIVSEHADELRYHGRGFGHGKTPQDYLDEFKNFINSNLNTIAALKVVCTRPHELTRESLISLKQELDRRQFTEKRLNTAWRELKNEDIAADIISYIRRFALGSALISHNERITLAVGKLRKNHGFTKMELDWLDKIEKTLLSETVIDRETFETGAFKTQGGFARANRIFGSRLDDYLRELNGYLYDDGVKTA
jgi:type I restriction enzyme R subunit